MECSWGVACGYDAVGSDSHIVQIWSFGEGAGRWKGGGLVQLSGSDILASLLQFVYYYSLCK